MSSIDIMNYRRSLNITMNKRKTLKLLYYLLEKKHAYVLQVQKHHNENDPNQIL